VTNGGNTLSENLSEGPLFCTLISIVLLSLEFNMMFELLTYTTISAKEIELNKIREIIVLIKKILDFR
jgi:hypothetical protein